MEIFVIFVLTAFFLTLFYVVPRILDKFNIKSKPENFVKKWKYAKQKYMGSDVIKTAETFSNKFKLSSYMFFNITQRACLTLQKHPQNGEQVFFSVKEGIIVDYH